MKKFTTHQAKTQFSQLMKWAQAGEDIVVCKGDVPVVRLVPITQGESFPGRPQVGTITSAPICYNGEFFAPMTEEELDEWGL